MPRAGLYRQHCQPPLAESSLADLLWARASATGQGCGAGLLEALHRTDAGGGRHDLLEHRVPGGPEPPRAAAADVCVFLVACH